MCDNIETLEYDSVEYDSVGSDPPNCPEISPQDNSKLIDELYSSMSKIIESLSLDNLLINRQIQKLKINIDELNKYVINKNTDNQNINMASQNMQNASMQNATASQNLTLEKIYADIEEIKSQQKYNLVLNNRNLFIQLINDVKKELKQDIKNLENKMSF
jgi:frataxin-like iron-binding protein CyaY